MEGVAEASTTGVLGQAAAHHGHVAGLVVHAVLLLEAAVVLLVDDDQAEVLVGQEEGGAGADHDARLPVGRSAPGAGPLARRQRGMPFDRRGSRSALVKRSMNWLVSAISGSMMSACRPFSSVRATASK